MRIDFFEEFPEDIKNLNKSKLIKFNSTIYIAAKSFKNFKDYKKKLFKINPKLEAAYWPLLTKSYWISPFSYTWELKKLIKEFKDNKSSSALKFLIDLELPIKKDLMRRNFFCYWRNKKLIKFLFKNQNKLGINISTAECALINFFTQKKMELQGISYPLKKYPHKKIIMFYPSMVKEKKTIQKIQKYLIKKHRKEGGNLHVALGTIAIGIRGDEPVLTPKYFKIYLDFLEKIGIKRVIVFRLGGLNRDYLKIINQFIK